LTDAAFLTCIFFFSRQCFVACTTASTESAAQYLTAQANNPAAINLLVQAPQTISGGYGFMEEDLRPYSKPVAVVRILSSFALLIVFSAFARRKTDAGLS
jgi:hypothetical protein